MSAAPLYQTLRGTALLCTCCNRVELALGNAVLHLDREGLAAVGELVDSFGAESAADSPVRSFVMRTRQDDAAFAFDRSEVLELRELVRGTEAALLAREVFTLGSAPASGSGHQPN